MTAAERDRQMMLEDEGLGRYCELSFVRSGGPGGQHRNKVSSGVRVKHVESGVIASAVERRSQHENRKVAMTRLRQAIAVEVRCGAEEAMPGELAEILVSKRWPHVSPGKLDYWRLAACVLDRLAADGVRVSDTAARLGVSTASLIHFLGGDDLLWRTVCHMREAAGLGTLRR